MFSRLFKTINPVVILLLALVTVLFAFKSLLHPSSSSDYFPEPFANLLFHDTFLRSLSPLFHVFIALFIVFISALLLNRIVVKNNFFQRSGYFTAFFFILINACNPEMFTLNPVLFVNYLLILIIDRVFKLYKKQRVLRVLFDTGFLIGITQLLYAPSFLLLPWLLLSINTLRPFQWREWVVSFLGMLSPWVISVSLWFLWDKHELFTQYWTIMGSEYLNWKEFLFQWSNLPFVFLTIIIGLSILFLSINYFKNVIAIRKYLQLLLLFLILVVLTMFLKMHGIAEHFLLLSIPLSVLIANYYQLTKSKWLSEVLLIGLTLSVIIGQFL